MPGQLARKLKPEEEELLRKREELAATRSALAELELELVDLRSNLAAFEGRYLRQVGSLYAELDEWKARIAELRAKLHPSAASNAEAEDARAQARQTFEDAHGKASNTPDVSASPDLKRLFREVAKRIHPDFGKDSADLERRTRLMGEANRAYEVGDVGTLQRILDEYQDASDAVEGEGIGAELVRIIRQISMAKARLAAITHELASLRESDIALLRSQAEESDQKGRDLLTELATAVREQIKLARKIHETLTEQEGKPA